MRLRPARLAATPGSPRDAVRAAEHFADGVIGPQERRVAREAAWGTINWDDYWSGWPSAFAVAAATLAASDGAESVWDYTGRRINAAGLDYDLTSKAVGAARSSAEAACFEAAQRREEKWAARSRWERGWREVKRILRGGDPAGQLVGCQLTFATEAAEQAALVRDLFGNPFRPSACDLSSLAWNGGTIPTLARVVYEERALPGGRLDAVRLDLLADMLKDAGCIDPQILDHLRGAGPHVRGCWVLDLLLGKE